MRYTFSNVFAVRKRSKRGKIINNGGSKDE